MPFPLEFRGLKNALRTDGLTDKPTDGRRDPHIGFTKIFSTNEIFMRECCSNCHREAWRSQKEPIAQRHQIVSNSLALLIFTGFGLPSTFRKQVSGFVGVQSPVEWGEIMYVHPSIRPSIRTASWLVRRPGWLDLKSGWLALRPGWLALRPSQLALRPSWQALRPGGTDEETNGRSYRLRELLPNLQDFVPHFGRCPKSTNKWTTMCLKYGPFVA